MRPTKDEYFLKMLRLVASRSTCGRRAVGAIIVDEHGHILATGYNGVPMGMIHCIDSPCPGRGDQPGDSSRCLAVHAEQNALMQCSRLDLADTIYVSNTPCFTCAKMIANTNIRRVVSAEPYADKEGRAVLAAAGKRLVEHGAEQVKESVS